MEEEDARKLPMRGIGVALTGDYESATATELGGGGHGGLGLRDRVRV